MATQPNYSLGAVEIYGGETGSSLIGRIRITVTTVSSGAPPKARSKRLLDTVSDAANRLIALPHDRLDVDKPTMKSCVLVSPGMVHWVHLVLIANKREEGGATGETIAEATDRAISELRDEWQRNHGGRVEVDDDVLVDILTRLLGKLREKVVPTDPALLEQEFGAGIMSHVSGSQSD